jgi:serine/threonine protein kinase/ankyrin repeat protein
LQVVDLNSSSGILHQRVVAACEQKDYESLKKFLQNKKVIKPMLSQLDANGCTPLQLAVSLGGDIVVVDALLGAMDPGDVNAVDKFGNTALHEACKATATKNDRVLEALLGAPGLDATIANADENTALHYFCQKYSTVNCAQLGGRMLELGGISLVLKQNKNRETALHYAMFNPQFRLPMARFLIKATTGNTALGGANASHRAGAASSASGDGPDTSGRGDGEKNTTDDAGNLFLNAQNTKGETALHFGVRLLRPDVVQLLLGAGADHRLKNNSGESPRELAENLIKKGERSNNAVSSGDPLPVIIAALDNASYLREWLEQPSIELGRLVGNFLRGGVTRDELPELTETHLNDMGIKSAGPRIRIMKAIKELRKKESGSVKKRRTKKKNSVTDGAAASEEKRDSVKPDEDPVDAAPSQPDFGSARMHNIKQQLEKLQYIKVDAGDWIDASTLEFLEELGSGACGTVMRGVYRHPKDGSVHPVAIKVLKEAETEKETEEFKKEFQILSAVKSPYMVHFFGACLHPQMAMVMELCSNGSVWKVLQTDSGIKVHWPETLEWAVQLASGVAALHNNEPQIVHRDLKTLNLLLSNDWIIKVCDFGLSRFSTTCFDAVDHQLLTSDGFLFLDEVLARVEWRVVNGRVVVTDWRGLAAATYNAKTAQLVYRQPLALGVNWGEQNFVEIGTEKYAPTVDWATRAGQHAAVSVVATGNHQMYVSKVGRAGKARQLREFDKVALADLPSLGCTSVRMLAAPYGGVALDEPAASAVAADDDMPLLDDLGANWRTELAPLQLLNLDREGAQPGGELLDEAAARAQVALFLRVFGYWLGDGSLVASVPHVRLSATKLRDVVFLRQALVKLGLVAIKVGRTAPLESDDDDRWWDDEDNFDCVKRDGVVQCWMSRANARGEKAHDIADERWVHFFASECESGGKRFPQWLLRKLSTKGLRNVVWGLHFADGQSAASGGRSTKERHVWTSSVLMRDQLELVLVRAGFSVRTTLKAPTGSSPVQWCVSWAVEHVAEPVVQLRRSERDADVFAPFSKRGISWCFDMQSVVGANDGFVVVRRAARHSVKSHVASMLDMQRGNADCCDAPVNERLAATLSSLSAQAQAVGVVASDVAVEEALREFGAADWVVFAASRPTIQGNSNVETLAKMRGTMAYCVPEEHEILTNRGFMDLETYTKRAAVDRSLLVASYDKRNEAMTFEKPQRLIVQPRQTRSMVELSAASDSIDTWGDAAGAYGVVGGARRGRAAATSGVSVLVTREHHLYAQFGGVDRRQRTTWHDAPYEKIEAGDFLDNDVHERSGAKLHALRQKTGATGGYNGPNKPRSVADVYALAGVRHAGASSAAPLALFYELYGYWLGDGAFDVQSRTATFADVRDVAWLTATLTALFGAERWCTSGATFVVLDEQWNELIGQEYGRRFAGSGGDVARDDKRAIRALQRLKERDVDECGAEPRGERAERWATAKAASESAAASAPLSAPRRAVAAAVVQRDANGGAFDAVSSASGSYVACETHSSAKWTAWWVWTLDSEAVRGVIRGVRRADGARAKSSAAILTSSARFRDELVRLCYQAGYTVRFSCKRRAGSVCGAVSGCDVVCDADIWAVRWCDSEQMLQPVLQKARGDVRERVYTGRVWCFTMPSGFIWTRRAFKDERGVVTKASRALLTGQCPPEAYFGERFTDRSDLYSVAVILWEMVNRCIKGEYNRPFYEYPNLQLDFQIIIQVARKSKRPTLPPSTPPALADLIQRCWQKDRDQRPTAAAVRDELLALQASFEQDPAPWNQAYVGVAAEQFAKLHKPADESAAAATPNESAAAGEDPSEASESESNHNGGDAKSAAPADAPASPASEEPSSATSNDKPVKLSSSGSRKGSRRKAAAAAPAAGAVSPRSPLAESANDTRKDDDDDDDGNNNNDDNADGSGASGDDASGGGDDKVVRESSKRRRRVKRTLDKSGTTKE